MFFSFHFSLSPTQLRLPHTNFSLVTKGRRKDIGELKEAVCICQFQFFWPQRKQCRAYGRSVIFRCEIFPSFFCLTKFFFPVKRRKKVWNWIRTMRTKRNKANIFLWPAPFCFPFCLNEKTSKFLFDAEIVCKMFLGLFPFEFTFLFL